jgi:hypothetical protein
MTTAAVPTASKSLSCERILAIAHADAISAYRDLSRYRIELALEDDGWHVDYRLKQLTCGGGPHYVIDARTGAIISKRYEQ